MLFKKGCTILYNDMVSCVPKCIVFSYKGNEQHLSIMSANNDSTGFGDNEMIVKTQ